MTAFRIAYPMFPTTDIGRGTEFYVSSLGFTVVFQTDDYARVKRDSVVLDLWKCTSPGMKGHEPGCWLMVADIEALFAELRPRFANLGVDAPRPALTELVFNARGSREFAILDPDNNVIHVAQAAS